MSTGDRWQPPQIKEVQRFLDKGMSASAIAIKLGRTRCSVLGIIHRQKLTRPGVPTLTRISPPTPRRVRYAGYTRQPSQPPKSLPPPREIPNSELVAAMPNPKRSATSDMARPAPSRSPATAPIPSTALPAPTARPTACFTKGLCISRVR